MKATLRLLIPKKRGSRKRIEAVMREGGVQVAGFRVRKEIQGIRDAEIEITYVDQKGLTSALARVDSVPGVVLLSLVAKGPHDRPSV